MIYSLVVVVNCNSKGFLSGLLTYDVGVEILIDLLRVRRGLPRSVLLVIVDFLGILDFGFLILLRKNNKEMRALFTLHKPETNTVKKPLYIWRVS